jgi:hypothetical protein
MGRIYIRGAVTGEAAPAFARELAADGVDLLILVPACPLDHSSSGGRRSRAATDRPARPQVGRKAVETTGRVSPVLGASSLEGVRQDAARSSSASTP